MEIDRMMPSEKNIQNRIKEYYDVKVNMDQLTRRVTEVNEVGRRRAVVATFTPETVFDEQKNACNFYIWSNTKYKPEDYSSIDPSLEV